MNMTPSASNIFDFDWYGRKFGVSNTETSYSALVFEQSVCNKLAGSNPLADAAKLSWTLTRFVAPLTRNNANVYINEKNNDSYTDGKRIMVTSLSGWENVQSTAAWRMDTYIGLSLHEACHVKYTDFNVLKSYNLNKTEQWLSNVIEDECIENTLRNERKGYGKFIDVVKGVCLNADDITIDTKNKLQTIFDLLFTAIRLPNKLKEVVTEEIKSEYSDLFFKIYNILSVHGCLIEAENETKKNNTRNNIEAAKEICALIKEETNTSGEEMDKQQKQESSPSSSKQDGGESEEEMKQELDELEGELKELIEEVERGATTEEEKKMLEDILKGTSAFGTASTIEKRKNYGVNNKAQYKKYYNIVYPYINKVAQSLRVKSSHLNYKTTKYNMTGQLDGSCIANAFIGDKFVNKQLRKVKTKESTKLAVVLLSDMSGSMSEGHAADRAGMMTTLFAEAVEQVSELELYVYNHSDYVKCICDNNNYKKDKYNIGNINCKAEGMGCQNEVMAYKMAVADVRKKTNLPICLINFTDSEYFSYPGDIKETVEMLKEKENCKTTLVCLNERDRNVYNETIYGKGNYINVNRMGTEAMRLMTSKLSKIISKMYK